MAKKKITQKKMIVLYWPINLDFNDDDGIDKCLTQYINDGWELIFVNSSEGKLIHHLIHENYG